MPISYSTTSLSRLAEAHPDLQRVFYRAAKISGTNGLPLIDWKILEVARTVETQRRYVAKGASQTMDSRHIPKPVEGLKNPVSHAVDAAPIIDGEITWAWPVYYELAKIIKEAARLEGVPIEWGGDWRKFKDGPHWQLPKSKYP